MAKKHKITKCQSIIPTLSKLKSILINGNVVIFGFTVYSNFQSESTSSTGILTMPNTNDTILGAHSVVIVGYNDNKQHFIISNSFGKAWGDKGYFYMPYQYILNPNLCYEFWIIQEVSI